MLFLKIIFIECRFFVRGLLSDIKLGLIGKTEHVMFRSMVSSYLDHTIICFW